MVIVNFLIENKANRPKFFQETFLVTNTKFKVILKMFFSKISNANILFGEKTLTWKSYITNKTLLIIKQV